MSKITVFIENSELDELQDLTKSGSWEQAVARAIQFTLLHDKDSVQGALKS